MRQQRLDTDAAHAKPAHQATNAPGGAGARQTQQDAEWAHTPNKNSARATARQPHELANSVPPINSNSTSSSSDSRSWAYLRP